MGLPFVIARGIGPLWLVEVDGAFLECVDVFGILPGATQRLPIEAVIGVVSIDPAAVLFGGRLEAARGEMRKAAEAPRRIRPRGKRFQPISSPWGHFTGFGAVRETLERHRRETPSEEVIRLSAIFAVSTVRTSIEQAEKSFSCFVDLYRREGVMPPVDEVKKCFRGLQNSKARVFQEVAAYAPVIRDAIASGLRDRALRKYLATQTDLPVGLGLSKLSFVLALLGNDTVCLDARLLTRMFDTREKATAVEDGWGKTGKRVSELGVARYQRVEEAFLKGNPLWDSRDPIGRAKAQWQSWESVGGEPATHSVWLRAISENPAGLSELDSALKKIYANHPPLEGPVCVNAADAKLLGAMAHVPVVYEAGVAPRGCRTCGHEAEARDFDGFDSLAQTYAEQGFSAVSPVGEGKVFIYKEHRSGWVRLAAWYEGYRWHVNPSGTFVDYLPPDASSLRDWKPEVLGDYRLAVVGGPASAGEDYVPKGPDGKPVGDKTPSYFDAKREADKHNGYVEWADEARRRSASKQKKLRWHRGKAEGVDFLYAEGAMGVYQVARQRVNRRQGMLRWGVSVDGRPLKSFDSVDKAKQFAANYDEITAIGGYHVAPQRQAKPDAWDLDKKLPAGLPSCAPFITTSRDEAAFSACMAQADRIGPITKPEHVYALLKDYCAQQSQEVFLVISLDLHGKLLGIEQVAKGQIDRVNVGVDDVIRAALSRNAKGFIIAHCHPTGKARPSKADKDLTKTIEEARAPFGNNLKLVDHIVIGLGEFSSIRKRKLFRAKR